MALKSAAVRFRTDTIAWDRRGMAALRGAAYQGVHGDWAEAPSTIFTLCSRSPERGPRSHARVPFGCALFYGVRQIQEPVRVQALGPQAPVERLNEGVARPWLSMPSSRPSSFQPKDRIMRRTQIRDARPTSAAARVAQDGGGGDHRGRYGAFLDTLAGRQRHLSKAWREESKKFAPSLSVSEKPSLLNQEWIPPG